MAVDLSPVDSPEIYYSIENVRVEDGNHVRFTLPAKKAGQYRLRVYAQARAGVEACEGFTSCDAILDEASYADVTVE